MLSLCDKASIRNHSKLSPEPQEVLPERPATILAVLRTTQNYSEAHRYTFLWNEVRTFSLSFYMLLNLKGCWRPSILTSHVTNEQTVLVKGPGWQELGRQLGHAFQSPLWYVLPFLLHTTSSFLIYFLWGFALISFTFIISSLTLLVSHSHFPSLFLPQNWVKQKCI